MAEVKQSVACEQKYYLEEVVKQEREAPHECIVCSERTDDARDIYSTRTLCGDVCLHEFLCRFTRVSLEERGDFSKYMCDICYSLVNILERAEVEYNKLRAEFENIICKNPLFGVSPPTVKLERPANLSSDDEPLSLAKMKRHKHRRTKKKLTDNKSKRRKKDKVAEITIDIATHQDISCESPMESTFEFGNMKTECSDNDDEEEEEEVYEPADESNDSTEEQLVIDEKKGKRKCTQKKQKPVHKCDQCDAKYCSPVRLMYHKMKHEGSKPPYICEICGAHYKHRKACDVHIAMHKGISDWKCEECDKLFPSKAALQRHNNIHTGKANYQCDLCGKSFIHTSSFKMHKLAHSGVKPHTCGLCGLSLMTRSHLKRHARVHSGEKKHQCPLCGKRFSERYNLVAHGKAHDAAARVSAPAQHAALQAVIAAVPRRRLFRCNYCEHRFERRYMLERHMETVHERPLERAPPKPRNTMSKLLKAQAANAANNTTPTNATTPNTDTQVKVEPLGLVTNAKPNTTTAPVDDNRGWHTAYSTYAHYGHTS